MENINNCTSKNIGNIIWVREKKIQEFMESVLVDAIVSSDSCIRDGYEYTFEYDWDNNKLTIKPIDKNGIVYFTIIHNLDLYRHAFDLIKKELTAIIGINYLPNYLNKMLTKEDYDFLTKITNLRQKKHLSFTYFDKLYKEENNQIFMCPEFYYWYKHTNIYNMVFRIPYTSNIPTFMEKIYHQVSDRMEKISTLDDLDTGYGNHIKEYFYHIFPSVEVLDNIMTENKNILNFNMEIIFAT
jgi:hypothetical protein